MKLQTKGVLSPTQSISVILKISEYSMAFFSGCNFFNISVSFSLEIVCRMPSYRSVISGAMKTLSIYTRKSLHAPSHVLGPRSILKKLMVWYVIKSASCAQSKQILQENNSYFFLMRFASSSADPNCFCVDMNPARLWLTSKSAWHRLRVNTNESAQIVCICVRANHKTYHSSRNLRDNCAVCLAYCI